MLQWYWLCHRGCHLLNLPLMCSASSLGHTCSPLARPHRSPVRKRHHSHLPVTGEQLRKETEELGSAPNLPIPGESRNLALHLWLSVLFSFPFFFSFFFLLLPLPSLPPDPLAEIRSNMKSEVSGWTKGLGAKSPLPQPLSQPQCHPLRKAMERHWARISLASQAAACSAFVMWL